MAKDESLEILQARIKEDMRRAQEMLKAAAKEQYASAKKLVANYAEHWTDAQRDLLSRFLGPQQAKSPKATKRAKRANTLRGVKIPPKYQLPSGETWAGRGKMKTAFVAYADKHGIDMDRRTQGGKDFPLYKAPGVKAAKTAKPAKPAKTTKSAAKPAARKSTAKAGSKPAKRAARKTPA